VTVGAAGSVGRRVTVAVVVDVAVVVAVAVCVGVGGSGEAVGGRAQGGQSADRSGRRPRRHQIGLLSLMTVMRSVSQTSRS
jgi:hypothetical protein